MTSVADTSTYMDEPGKFFTRDHRHLATVVQEGIFRSA